MKKIFLSLLIVAAFVTGVMITTTGTKTADLAPPITGSSTVY